MTCVEEWRPVVGAEDRYAVSSLGRVKRLARVTMKRDQFGRPRPHKLKERVMATSRRAGYPCVSPAENAADAIAHGTFVLGERCGTSKLNTAQVEILKALRHRVPAKEIGAVFGVSHMTVYGIWHGHDWKHVTPLAADIALERFTLCQRLHAVSGDDAAGHDVIRTLRAQGSTQSASTSPTEAGLDGQAAKGLASPRRPR